jgi:hypothetical protein
VRQQSRDCDWVMLYQVKSSKSLDEIERDLKDSAARHQFGVIAMHDL